MEILGATIVDDNTFIIDGLKCEVDREYRTINFDKIPQSVLSVFRKYGLDYGYDSFVSDLEGLVL